MTQKILDLGLINLEYLKKERNKDLDSFFSLGMKKAIKNNSDLIYVKENKSKLYKTPASKELKILEQEDFESLLNYVQSKRNKSIRNFKVNVIGIKYA